MRNFKGQSTIDFVQNLYFKRAYPILSITFISDDKPGAKFAFTTFLSSENIVSMCDGHLFVYFLEKGGGGGGTE